MCVIIDACAFHAVFDRENAEHAKFAPIYDWIEKKKAQIVIGGTKYLKEVVHGKAQRILKEYERRGQVVKVSDEEVDRIEASLKRKFAHRDFDDPHLVALVAVSRCQVVCTNENRAIPFLRRPDLYPNGVRRPKIYKGAKNVGLCCSRNVVGACLDTKAAQKTKSKAKRKSKAKSRRSDLHAPMV